MGNPGYMNRLFNPIFFDIGPGNIKIRTAILMLQNYNRMFPDSDPLGLKQYNNRYDLLVRDLKNPDSDTTVKIAGLVAREGQDFFVNAMTPQRWGALGEDQRAAALTKYYAVGKERMEDDFRKQGAIPAPTHPISKATEATCICTTRATATGPILPFSRTRCLPVCERKTALCSQAGAATPAPLRAMETKFKQ